MCVLLPTYSSKLLAKWQRPFVVPLQITSTVTDNGSNFVKAFKRYQPVEEEDDEDDENEVTFTDINDVLQNSGGDDDNEVDVVITFPPHQRCAAHTLNLVSCTDVDKWLLSKPQTKAMEQG